MIMPKKPPKDAYNKALATARQRFFKGGYLQSNGIAQLELEYARMLTEITRQEVSGKLYGPRAESLRKSIRQALARYSDTFAGVLSQSVAAAAEAAAEGHNLALLAIAKNDPIAAFSFSEVPTAALENIMARRGIALEGGSGLSGTYRTLINRHASAAAAEIDSLISSAVGRGEQFGKFTNDLASMMSRNDPKVHAALKKLGPRGGRTLRAIKNREFVDPETLKRAKSLLYDARRIVTTEVNVAYHETNLMGMQQSPVVEACQWQTSGAHFAMPEDICDVYEQDDLYGMGAGIYPAPYCPSLPHPHCQCLILAVMKPVNEWGKESFLPEPKFLSDEQARKFLPDGVTDNFVQRQVSMGNKNLSLAAQIAQGVPVT